jgi:hypothetical protein
MVKKAGIELEAHWKGILEDFVGSNYGVGKYCQDRKISKASLYKWSKQLAIPIKNQHSLTTTHRTDGNSAQTSPIREKEAFSFIELKVSPSNTSISFPLKLELLLAQEHRLKIEVPSTWEQVVGMIKTLVS